MANGPTEELLKRLLAAVAAPAQEGGDAAARLIAQGRAEAEAEVKALIKAAYKAALLRNATEQLERARSPDAAPPSPRTRGEGGGEGRGASDVEEPLDAATGARSRIDQFSDARRDTLPAPGRSREDREERGDGGADRPDSAPAQVLGCYVYAITPIGAQDWLSGERGVDPHCPLELVTHDDVQAVVSAVSMAEFGQAALGERVNDPRWVEDKVRAHDLVVRRAMSAGAVIPCRFCTVVRSTDDVRQLLADRHQDIAAALTSLRGKQEWGVKVYAHLTTLSRQVEESQDEHAATRNGGASGKDYLRRKQRADTTRADAERLARAHADECHIALAAVGTDAARIPRRPRGGGDGGADVEPVLNGAYLVAERDVQRFHETVNALAERFRPQGLRFEVTGPWPPYNFVRLDLSLQQAAA